MKIAGMPLPSKFYWIILKVASPLCTLETFYLYGFQNLGLPNLAQT
jgi:hypothetical protein